MANPLVAILMGSANDEPLLEPTKKVLDELGVPYVVRAMSAHPSPPCWHPNWPWPMAGKRCTALPRWA